MVQGFTQLSESQFQITKDAVVWITVLIAGADGEIDEKETSWAEKVTKIRGYHNPNELTPFYEEVGKEFAQNLTDFIQRAPANASDRKDILERKLAQLNDILALLDNKIAHSLYKSYLSFAEHVAKASGGFLGFLSVNTDENKLIKLPMLNEVVLIEEEEE